MIDKLDKVKIGNIEIDKLSMLAPMASVADKAYRQMCKKYGAVMVVGEMASAKGMFYSDRKTAELLEVSKIEEPMAVQLFGSEPECMALACKKAAKFNPQFIDINMGCPVPKVVSTGSGSALMKTPQLAKDIVSACVDAVSIPITVKIRKGFDDSCINAVELAVMLEEAGASAIAVHGRTRQQMYRPPVDIDIITEVKKAVKVPVIGNGDITSPELAQQMYDTTNCDLVMIGRGSYGRPWIFEEVNHFLKTGLILPEKSLDEKLDIMMEHIALICEYKTEGVGMREARKNVAWYLKGVHGASKFRNLCSTLNSYEDLKFLVNQVKKENIENL